MANIVFNIAKGKAGYYAGLPATNDALVVVPLEVTDLESDATLVDYDTLADLLAGASNEQVTMGRKVLADVTATVDDANDRLDVDAGNVTWVEAGGDPVGALVICYDPDTTASTDADLIPLTKHDFDATPSGGDITAQISSPGFYRAS